MAEDDSFTLAECPLGSVGVRWGPLGVISRIHFGSFRFHFGPFRFISVSFRFISVHFGFISVSFRFISVNFGSFR